MSEKIYGKVTYDSDIEYEWMTEPGACEKCRALDGKRFQHSDEIPDRPHPNCKCWIKVHMTYKDPLKNLRETRIKARHEREKLEGDIRVLQDENTAYLNAVRTNIGDGIYKEVLKDIVGADIKTIIQLQELNNELKTIEKYVKDNIDDILVASANPTIASTYGLMHIIFNDMPESYEFFKIGIQEHMIGYRVNNTNNYIQKNGHMYNSLSELNNPQEAKRILARIHAEKEEKHRTDTRILVLNEHSSVAQKIVRSVAMKNFILSNTTRLVNDETITNQKIEFTSIDDDLYSTFHGAMIREAYIDYNDDLIITLEDYYNFNPGRTSVKGRVGYKLEKQGDLIPYYVIVNIKVPRSVYESIW